MKDIENPAVIDALWRHQEQPKPKVVAYCEGCEEEIVEGQDIFDLNGCFLHHDSECCRQYIGSLSIEKVAGEA